MKKTSKMIALGAMTLASSSVMALDMPDLSEFYYNAQISMFSVDVSNVEGSGAASVKALTLEIGTLVYSHDAAVVFVEAVASLGLGGDTAFSYGGNSRYQAEIAQVVGVQAKAYRQLARKFAGFINLGIMNVSTTLISETCLFSVCASNTPDIDNSTMGLSYSFGGEYQLSQSSAITMSYNALPSDKAGASTIDISSLNLGYKARF